MPKRINARYHDLTLEELKDDPHLAVHYLNQAMRESPGTFLLCLRDIVHAHGSGNVAETARVSSKNLPSTLSTSANPKLMTIINVLNAVGLRLAIRVADNRKSYVEVD